MMRLVTIDSRDLGGRPGLWLDEGILDLLAAPGSLRATQRLPASVISILAESGVGRGRLARLAETVAAASETERERWRGAGVLLPAAGTQLLAPVRRPALVLVLEDDGRRLLKNPHAVSAPGRELELPPAYDTLAARVHLALVLDRPLYRADPAQARSALAACTLMLEFGPGGQGELAGGQFPGACPLGPALLLLEDPGVLAGMAVGVNLNGHQVGSGNVPAPIRDPVREVAQLSQEYGLRPGDIIAFPAELPRPLRVQPGDRLTIALGQDLLQLEAVISPGNRSRR